MPYPLYPNPATSYTPAYGGIPTVPSPTGTAAEAVAGNIGNLGGLYQLAGGVNQFNQQQAPLGLQTNLPGYQGMIGQSSQNILANLRGQIPQDVVNQITQQAAERGTATGLAGSPNSSAALLAALGKTSLGQQQLGEQELTTAIGRTPQGPLFDPSKFFVTPEQEQQAQAAANLYASAPVPSAAAAEARRQATAGLGAGGGGTQFAPTAPSPIRATTWGGGGGGGAGGASLGTGTTYGGITYPEGSTPQTAATNWNQWYASLPKSTPMGTTGTGSFYAGAANPMYADEYDALFNPEAAGTYSPTDVPMAAAGGAALPGTLDWTGVPSGLGGQTAADLFGTLTPEDLASFG